MIETFYLIRDTDRPDEYIVSKWEELSPEPKAIYRVTLGKRNKCNCPSGHNRGYCKHPQMVKDWIGKGLLDPIKALAQEIRPQ